MPKHNVSLSTLLRHPVMEPEKEIEECIAIARQSLESGRALETLKKFIMINSWTRELVNKGDKAFRHDGWANLLTSTAQPFPPRQLVNFSPLSSTQKTKTMKDILSEIIAHKRIEIEQQKQAVSLSQLQEQAAAMMQETVGTGASGTTPVRSMKRALANSSSGIIAEFKRPLPSKAGSRKAHRPTSFLLLMKLPELPPSPSSRMKKFFGGTLRDIRTARPLVNIPILRKDFIIDKHQLLQARIVGADAVLLIAACLTPDECHTLTMQAHELGPRSSARSTQYLRTLLYIYKETDMVGVNNRNLGSFVTNIGKLFPHCRRVKKCCC